MKIILANSTTEVEVYQVIGELKYVNNQNRDSLTFSLPATYSLEEVDAMFSESACESIKLIDTDGEYIHKGYTIRVEIKKQSVEVEPETSETESVMEDRIFVTMAQRTYMESKVTELESVMNTVLGV